MCGSVATSKSVALDHHCVWGTGIIFRSVSSKEYYVDLVISGLGGEETKPENSVYCRYWFYMTKLCELMYNQGLLDRQEFLQWLLDAMEKYRYPDDPVLKLLLPLVLQYTDEFVKSELLSRKMAYQCSKKITMLVNDTDAINA